MPHKLSAIGAAAALLFCCSVAAPAMARDDLLETLAQKGVISADEYEKIRAQAPKPAPSFSTDDGLKLASSDGAFSLQLGTLQQIDFAAFKSDGSDLADGSQLRRSRLSVAGTLFKDFQYRVEYEFRQAATGNGTPITDAYVAYTAYKPVTITVGQFKPSFSMEALSADKNATFMERGLPFYLVTPLVVRTPGLQLSSSGAQWSLAGGVSGEPLGNSSSGDEGWGLAARGTLVPYLQGDHLIHVGVGSLWRKTTADNSSVTTGSGAAAVTTTSSAITFTTRPESDQGPALVSTPALLNTRDYRFIGAELAGAWGPASLQGEFDWINVSRDKGRDDLAFKTWYAQAAYTLTGEVRPYKVDKGVFDGIRPAHPFAHDGGWGAFEIAARLSAINLNDGSIRGGRQRDATLGASWYLNNAMRVSANYVKVLKVDGGKFDGQEPSIYQMRLQLAF